MPVVFFTPSQGRGGFWASLSRAPPSWSIRHLCRIAHTVSRISFQLKNGFYRAAKIALDKVSLHMLVLCDPGQKSLFLKGIFPHVNLFAVL
jgi:hypothetical protein